MVKLSRSYYERETARLRRAHEVGIALAQRANSGQLRCVHGPDCAGHIHEVVAIALELCAVVRRDLAALKAIGF